MAMEIATSNHRRRQTSPENCRRSLYFQWQCDAPSEHEEIEIEIGGPLRYPSWLSSWLAVRLAFSSQKSSLSLPPEIPSQSRMHPSMALLMAGRFIVALFSVA